MISHSRVGAVIFALAFTTVSQLQAGLITNGGFESGLSGWTLANQAGGDGTFSIQTGTSSPINGDPVPAPPEGTNAAMSDGGGPGSHVLYQDFAVANTSLALATLSFELFIGNRSSLGFFTPNPNTLDFSILNVNQQARVDILKGGTGLFSIAPSDVLMSVYATKAGDPLVSGYVTITANLTSLLNANQGQTLRIRFAEVDNGNGPLQMGVDNVSLEATSVPEPSTLISAAIAILGSVALSRRRRVTL